MIFLVLLAAAVLVVTVWLFAVAAVNNRADARPLPERSPYAVVGPTRGRHGIEYAHTGSIPATAFRVALDQGARPGSFTVLPLGRRQASDQHRKASE